MTDISLTPVTRTRATRSPFAVVASGARRVLRSYSNALAADAFIVPNGRMAYAARQAS